jgi:hypothetical protein
MFDPKPKRAYEKDTAPLPGLRVDPQDPTQTESNSGAKHVPRYDDLELSEQEKVVNKLIDHLKDL